VKLILNIGTILSIKIENFGRDLTIEKYNSTLIIQ